MLQQAVTTGKADFMYTGRIKSGFEVFTALLMMIEVLWSMTPC
jgi:hypothetical protein